LKIWAEQHALASPTAHSGAYSSPCNSVIHIPGYSNVRAPKHTSRNWNCRPAAEYRC